MQSLWNDKCKQVEARVRPIFRSTRLYSLIKHRGLTVSSWPQMRSSPWAPLPLHLCRHMCFLPICCPFHQLASQLLHTHRKCAFSKKPNALEMPSPPPNPANLNSTLKPASGFRHLSPYFHTNIRISHCDCCKKTLTNKATDRNVPVAPKGAALCRSSLFYFKMSGVVLLSQISRKIIIINTTIHLHL